jgi:hypothetical protein
VQPLLQWKTMSITYSECVFVALVSQHEHAYANDEDFVRIFELYLAVIVTDMYSKNVSVFIRPPDSVHFLLLFPLCTELRNFYVFSSAAGGYMPSL